MSFFEAIILGIIQGLTEFLPVSSSGHLVIFEKLLGLEIDATSQKGFDVILHFGTLLAIIFYFKQDLVQIFKGLGKALKTKSSNPELALFKNLIIATIPALFVGFFFSDFLDQWFRNTTTVAIMLFLTGLLLTLSEKFPKQKQKKKLNLKEAFFVGCAQACALIPGISRSGATISMAMFQGVKREMAARFAFLMAIPAITAAMGYVLLQAHAGKVLFPHYTILFMGFIASFVSSYLCVKFLMYFIQKHSLSVFSWYLFVVSGVLLVVSM